MKLKTKRTSSCRRRRQIILHVVDENWKGGITHKELLSE